MFKANQYMVDTAMPFTTGVGGMSEGGASGGASATAPAANSVESVEQLSYDRQREQKEKYLSLYVDAKFANYYLELKNQNLERVATYWQSRFNDLEHEINKLAAENKRLEEENARLNALQFPS